MISSPSASLVPPTLVGLSLRNGRLIEEGLSAFEQAGWGCSPEAGELARSD